MLLLVMLLVLLMVLGEGRGCLLSGIWNGSGGGWWARGRAVRRLRKVPSLLSRLRFGLAPLGRVLAVGSPRAFERALRGC